MQVISEFENQLRHDIEDDHMHGSMSAAVIREDKIIWAAAFGPTNTQGHRPADTGTIYRAGSISKSFTAFLMMQLIQEGALDLDDPVESRFPEIRRIEGYSESTKFTFRHLASHTSGLLREPALENADSGPINEWERKVMESIPKTSLGFKPGERFSYSNIGYGILGLTLSRLAGKPFTELIASKILEPLQMENCFFVVPAHKVESLAQGIGGGPFGEQEPDLEKPHREHAGRGYKVPNGGLYSTPTDLAKFMICNMGYGKMMDRSHLESMHSRQTPEPGYHSYGLGFELYQDPTMSIAGHSGGVWGYSSYFGFEKESRVGVVLMRNYNWGVTSWDIGPKILLRKLKDGE